MLPVVAVAIAVGAGLVAAGGSDDAGSSATTTTWPDAVAISSDAPRVATVAELVAAADVVVRAEVVATERGRWFGGGDGSTRLQSRLATLAVTEVLAGTPPPDGTLLLEEEGWLEDGAPLVVDGAAPTQAGDDGIWFLVDGGDPEVGAYVAVGAQGRYLLAADGTSLTGASGDDPLVAAITAGTLEELVAAIGGR